MEEREFHSKVYWLTFIFSILVIWVHSGNAELFLGPGAGDGWVGRAERLLGSGLGQFAVPGFFAVSAYLFYRGFSMKDLARKWKSRIRSVLLPYALWNGLYYAGYVAATRLPAAAAVVGKPPVPLNWEECFRAVFFYAYNPVFWYLFQLILLTALAPVLYFTLKNVWTGAAAAGLLAVFLGFNKNFPVLNGDALFYYGFGAFAALHGRKWVEGRLSPARGAVWAVVLAAAFGGIYLMGRTGGLLYGSALALIFFRLTGVCAFVLAVRLLHLPAAAEFMKNNFFLYAMHFAWVRLINKSAALLLPPVPWSALGAFVLMPFVLVVLCTIFARLGRRFCPGIYGFLSGGR